jgi:quercetin dioxygenase-like cupin family protein
MDLREVVAEAGERSGTIWALMHSDDLNANLVRFPTGRGVEEHVNDELEVFFLGVSGSGVATVDKDEYVVSPGRMIFIPKGARRSTLSASENFAYLSIHRKRGTLQIGR